jgi:hypothetical protein
VGRSELDVARLLAERVLRAGAAVVARRVLAPVLGTAGLGGALCRRAALLAVPILSGVLPLLLAGLLLRAPVLTSPVLGTVGLRANAVVLARARLPGGVLASGILLSLGILAVGCLLTCGAIGTGAP